MAYRFNTKRIAYLGFMTALALILSYIESLFPFFLGAPGIKIGLANSLVLFLLYLFRVRDAIAVNAMRILLAGFLFGNMFSILYGFSGFICSMIAMLLMKKMKASVFGVSMAGGVFHNIGQLIAACFIVSSTKVVVYAPALIIGGLCCGLLIGSVAKVLMKYLKKSIHENDS